MNVARVNRRAVIRWAKGHPWIYRGDLVNEPTTGPGAVDAVDEGGRFLGVALWSPRSTISLRLLSREEIRPDAGFWADRINAAVRYRAEALGLGTRQRPPLPTGAVPVREREHGPAPRPEGGLREGPEAVSITGTGAVRDSAGKPAQEPGEEGKWPRAEETTGYRLVHGEADGLPSLIVDRYGDVLVVQLLSAGLEAFRREIVNALVEQLSPAGILARNDVPVRRHEGLPRSIEVLHGDVPQVLDVMEAGRRYLVEPRTGQKTGAFLDQRENRTRAAALSRGRVLDAFSYHASFALHLAAGAGEVTAVDSSRDALDRARANLERNALENVCLLEANVFDFLRAAESEGARYDLVILDPPAFAKRKDALRRALAGYKEINLRAMRILAPGGHLCTFSCSYQVDRTLFREMLASAAADAGRPMRWVETRGQAADHPEIVQIPESGYLKGAILQAADSY